MNTDTLERIEYFYCARGLHISSLSKYYLEVGSCVDCFA